MVHSSVDMAGLATLGVSSPNAYALGNNGLLSIQTNQQIEAESIAREALKAQQQFRDDLGSFIMTSFGEAEKFRGLEITERLVQCQRRYRGEYAPEKLTLIRQYGGSDTYFNITGTKIEAALAWIKDTFYPSDADKFWTIEPTPLPDLPEDIKAKIVEQVVFAFQQGQLPPDRQAVTMAAMDLYDQTLKEADEEAKRRVARMERKMEDQLVEGGFHAAMDEFLLDMCVFPLAILKGPVIQRKKRMRWTRGAIEVVYEDVPTWTRVAPQDFYPCPNSRAVEDGYVCELVSMDVRSLQDMKGVDGWNADAIDRVLRLGMDSGYGITSGGSMSLQGESDRARLEDRNLLYGGGQAPTQTKCVEFWGCVPGALLKKWNPAMAVDEGIYHEVMALVHFDTKEVLKAILNPDPLGRRPYSVSRYRIVPGSLWGLSISEKMADCQDNLNASMRSLINNLALASGFQTGCDIDVLAAGCDPTKVFPGKVWQYHGQNLGSNSRQPITFFQPDANSNELLKVAEYFESKADDRTLIPRYAHGNEDVGGAGQTFGGLQALMASASKGIKDVIGHIDSAVRDCLDRLYSWDLVYLPDAMLKGDARIVPRGTLAAMIKEQVQMRRQEFLNTTLNPVDQMIIGVKGRAALLREVAKRLDLPEGDIIPDDAELEMRVQQQQMMAAQQPEQKEADDQAG